LVHKVWLTKFGTMAGTDMAAMAAMADTIPITAAAQAVVTDAITTGAVITGTATGIARIMGIGHTMGAMATAGRTTEVTIIQAVVTTAVTVIIEVVSSLYL
jgi:hypothetical protein